MIEQFYPDEWLDSAYVIDYEKLYKGGCRGLIFDIDNTLVPHGAPADERAIALFRHLKEIGFSCCLLSNNKEPRVKMFNEKIGISYIFKAGKPGKKGYERAMQKIGTDKNNTVFIGDQLFTDVWSKKSRNSQYTCEAHQPERGDPDCPQTSIGMGYSVFL